MTIRKVELEYLQDKRAKLEDDQAVLRRQLQGNVSPLQTKAIENDLNQIFEEIDRVSQRIQAIERQQQQDRAEARTRDLVDLLTNYASDADLIKAAYQATMNHRKAPPRDVSEPAAYVLELTRTSQGRLPYTALEEFIARLFRQTEETGLVQALTDWGSQYCPERDWWGLSTDLEQSSRTDLRPAILIRLTSAEEATTQAGNQPHYQLRAWLVEDMDTYRQSKGGCHALIPEDRPEAKLFAAPADLTQFVARMEAQLQVQLDQLLNRFIEEANRRCEESQVNPEFHIFLPKALMALAVDQWLLDDHTRLGHDYRVVVRCLDRYRSAYKKSPCWRRLWAQHQQCLSNPSHPQFIAWDGQLETLREVLFEAEETEPDPNRATVLGLHCTTAPPPDGRAVFDELLRVGGLPLVLWGRCQVPTICNQTCLEKLLQATLADLPQQIDQQRREARRAANPADRHIGHHLFLLRDDPTLTPPKRA